MNPLQRFLKSEFFPLWLAFFLNIISWLIIRFKIHPTSEIVPLHYNVFYGTDYAGKGYWIYLIPAVGFIFILINFFFYKQAVKREKFGALMLQWVALVSQVFILLAIMFLKSIITS